MTTVRYCVLVTCILLAGSATARDAARKAEELRQSSEMMKPPTNAPVRSTSPPAAPVSEAEKRAEAGRKSSEAMKPHTSGCLQSTSNALTSEQGRPKSSGGSCEKRGNEA